MGLIESQLNGLTDVTMRRILKNCFEEALSQSRIGDDDKAQNFAWFQVQFTTHATANTEFSVVHGMEVPPNRFIPSVRMDVINSQMVPLVVSRAPDNKRAYFKSSSTSAVVNGHFE